MDKFISDALLDNGYIRIGKYYHRMNTTLNIGDQFRLVNISKPFVVTCVFYKKKIQYIKGISEDGDNVTCRTDDTCHTIAR